MPSKKNVFHEKMITWRALCNTTLTVNGNVADCVAKVLLYWFYPIYVHNLSVLCTCHSKSFLTLSIEN